MVFANYLNCVMLFHTILAIPLEHADVHRTQILRDVNPNYIKNLDGYPESFAKGTINIPKSENMNLQNIGNAYPIKEMITSDDAIHLHVDNVKLVESKLGNTRSQQPVQLELVTSPDPYHSINLSNMKTADLPINNSPQLVQNINRPKEQLSATPDMEYKQLIDHGIQKWPRPKLNEVSIPLGIADVRKPDFLQEAVQMASPHYISSLGVQPEPPLLETIGVPMFDQLFPINQNRANEINLNANGIQLVQNTVAKKSEQPGQFDMIGSSDPYQNMNLRNMEIAESTKNIYLQLLQHINKPKEQPSSVFNVQNKQFLNPGAQSWSSSELNEGTLTDQPLYSNPNVVHQVLKPQKKRYTIIHPNGTIEYRDHLDLNNYPNHLLVNSGDIANFANLYNENKLIASGTATTKTQITNQQKGSFEINKPNTNYSTIPNNNKPEIPLRQQSQIYEKSKFDFPKTKDLETDLSIINRTQSINSKEEDKNTIRNIGINMPLKNKNMVHTTTVKSNIKNNSSDTNNNLISSTIKIANSDKKLINEASIGNNMPLISKNIIQTATVTSNIKNNSSATNNNLMSSTIKIANSNEKIINEASIGNNMPLINKNVIHTATVTSNNKNNSSTTNNNLMSSTIKIANSDKKITNETSIGNNMPLISKNIIQTATVTSNIKNNSSATNNNLMSSTIKIANSNEKIINEASIGNNMPLINKNVIHTATVTINNKNNSSATNNNLMSSTIKIANSDKKITNEASIGNNMPLISKNIIQTATVTSNIKNNSSATNNNLMSSTIKIANSDKKITNETSIGNNMPLISKNIIQTATVTSNIKNNSSATNNNLMSSTIKIANSNEKIINEASIGNNMPLINKNVIHTATVTINNKNNSSATNNNLMSSTIKIANSDKKITNEGSIGNNMPLISKNIIQTATVTSNIKNNSSATNNNLMSSTIKIANSDKKLTNETSIGNNMPLISKNIIQTATVTSNIKNNSSATNNNLISSTIKVTNSDKKIINKACAPSIVNASTISDSPKYNVDTAILAIGSDKKNNKVINLNKERPNILENTNKVNSSMEVKTSTVIDSELHIPNSPIQNKFINKTSSDINENMFNKTSKGVSLGSVLTSVSTNSKGSDDLVRNRSRVTVTYDKVSSMRNKEEGILTTEPSKTFTNHHENQMFINVKEDEFLNRTGQDIEAASSANERSSIEIKQPASATISSSVVGGANTLKSNFSNQSAHAINVTLAKSKVNETDKEASEKGKIEEESLITKSPNTLIKQNVNDNATINDQDLKTISNVNNQSTISTKVRGIFSIQNNAINLTSTEANVNETDKINSSQSEQEENFIEDPEQDYADPNEIEISNKIAEEIFLNYSDSAQDSNDGSSAIDIDSEEQFWQGLFGENEDENVYFIFYNPKTPIIETDTKTTIYPNGTIVKEFTEIRNSDDGERTIKVTTTIEYPNGTLEFDEV